MAYKLKAYGLTLIEVDAYEKGAYDMESNAEHHIHECSRRKHSKNHLGTIATTKRTPGALERQQKSSITTAASTT